AVNAHPAVVAPPDRAEHAARGATVSGAPGHSPVRGEERGGDGLAGVGVDRVTVHGEPERRAPRHAMTDPPSQYHERALPPRRWRASSFTSAASPRWARPGPASRDTTSPSV